MSLNITLKMGETSKREAIQIINKETGEIILVGLSRIKGKQVRIRLIDNDHNFKINRIEDTYEETRVDYKPETTQINKRAYGGLE